MIKIIINRVLLLFLFVAFFIADNASAKTAFNPYINSTFYTQIRRNTIDENEWPFLEYLSAGASFGSGISFDVDLQVMGDPLSERSDFNLYTTLLTANNLFDVVSIRAGRMPLISGFSYDLMDGLDIVFRPDFILGLQVYGGLMRFIEIDQFYDYNFAAGGKVFLNGVKNTVISLEFRYESTQDSIDWFEIGILGSRKFGGNLSPRVFCSANYDLSYSILTQAGIGASIMPTPKIDLGISATRYDFKENSFDPWEDIFALFATGALWEFKQSLTFLAADNISIFENYALIKYDHDPGVYEIGHSVRMGGNVSFLDKKLNCIAMGYFDQSYGGRAIGADIKAVYKIFKPLTVSTRVGVLYFDKITGESDSSSAISLSVGYKLLNGLLLSVGGEFNSNDQFSRDFRGNLMVEYKFM